eukprot:m.79779 g.79779  ORF g.79779 m.79779 type:complete len:337 (-) comp25247_c1_seq1:1807-2817(-)
MSLLVAALLVSSSTAVSVCSVTRNGIAANLVCPETSIISSITAATFGDFNNVVECSANGSLPIPIESKQCESTSILAQVERHCVGKRNCSITCSCTETPPPPPPLPPASPCPPLPPLPHVPTAPVGFHVVGDGSCRDVNLKEPPFFGTTASSTLSVCDCVEACKLDTACTAVSFCAGQGEGKPCKGSCHIYTTSMNQPPPDRVGVTWSYSAGSGGDPHHVSRIATGAPWWYCYAKDNASSSETRSLQLHHTQHSHRVNQQSRTRFQRENNIDNANTNHTTPNLNNNNNKTKEQQYQHNNSTNNNYTAQQTWISSTFTSVNAKSLVDNVILTIDRRK